MLINSLKNKYYTVASILSTLMRSSKDLIDESKYSELQGTSALKLTRENSLENEKFVSDHSTFHPQVLNLSRKVEGMMYETIKVLIVDAHHCVQMENAERQQNMILETMGNHSRSREIGEATYQALEREDKVKAATLDDIIDTKVYGSVRKFYSEATLQMSKLAKKVIDLEKSPKERVHFMEGAQEKRARKKDKRQASKKEKRIISQQQKNAATRQEGNDDR